MQLTKVTKLWVLMLPNTFTAVWKGINPHRKNCATSWDPSWTWDSLARYSCIGCMAEHKLYIAALCGGLSLWIDLS